MALGVHESIECVERYVRLKSMLYETALLQSIYNLAESVKPSTMRLDDGIRELNMLENIVDEYDCSNNMYTMLYGLIRTHYNHVYEKLKEKVRA